MNEILAQLARLHQGSARRVLKDAARQVGLKFMPGAGWKKMNQGIDIYDVHFDGKEVPKQGRSFVVGKEDGTIFVSPAFAGVGDIEAIMCASYDGVSVIYEDEILYCPIDWLIKEFPKHAEDMKRTRKKMREIANGEHGPPRNEE